MYFPPYASLLNSIGLNKDELQNSDRVCIPPKLFQFLLQTALLSADFREQAYLQANPDVREAVQRGKLLNAKQHYLGYGYFEGRTGALPPVDEEWYLASYPDVGKAVSEGKVASATQHFHDTGAAEGRAPSKEHRNVADVWHKMLGTPQS